MKQSSSRVLGLAVSAFALIGSGALAAGKPASWRDLNHDGQRQPYEDSALTDDERADDLLARMTLEEKVGTMLHGSLWSSAPATPAGAPEVYDAAAVRRAVARGVTSFITRMTASPEQIARQNNALQSIAAEGRLGIPLTISTDPRHHFQEVLGASSAAGGFSQWPEPLGLAALNDERRVEEFGRIAAREYRAVGIHMALSPQADLFTEPRWSRGVATFGSDPALVSRLAGAYVRGFQGSATGLTRGGVATVVKHWAGYGAQPEGFDGHNIYGRFGALDDIAFRAHLSAFDGALAARTAGIMPTYVILQGVTWKGQPMPHVGAGFNRMLLQDMLRGERGFTGLVVSDWGITNDCPQRCQAPTAAAPQDRTAIGMPWGVEPLSREDRYALGANAGIDQFGGEDDPTSLLAAVRGGKIPVARVDDAARRAILLKFRLGLFDNPFVDARAAAKLVGAEPARRAGEQAQAEAQVLLENRNHLLPLRGAGRRVYLYGVKPEAARRAGLAVADRLEDADLAIVRLSAPHEQLHPHAFFGSRQKEGRLDFAEDDAGRAAFRNAAAKVPTVLAVDLDRPAILTGMAGQAGAVIAMFGASDAALLDVVTGKVRPLGRLPLEIPSSMAAVQAQHPARPDDSHDPLYRRGAGLSY